MTRGRKKFTAVPALKGHLPDEWMFLEQCKTYLATLMSPEPPFVRELLKRYIKLVVRRRLTGPEIAAMVDFRAIRMPSITKAIEFVHGFLGGQVSIEAIKQHHRRYGMRADELKAARKDFDQENWEADESVSADEAAQVRQDVQNWILKMEEYCRLQAELFPSETEE